MGVATAHVIKAMRAKTGARKMRFRRRCGDGAVLEFGTGKAYLASTERLDAFAVSGRNAERASHYRGRQSSGVHGRHEPGPELGTIGRLSSLSHDVAEDTA